jgi:archaellum component FlaC
MPKAILELEMPESCWQCPCIQDRIEDYSWCGVIGGDCPDPPYEKRRDDCPLKLVEKKEVNNMRLTDDQIKMIRFIYAKIMQDDFVLDLIDTIEALQQENEQLKANCDKMLGEVQELTTECNRFKERLQISPYGDDKIDELDEALENYKFQYEQLKQENELLNAQVAQMWKALSLRWLN